MPFTLADTRSTWLAYTALLTLLGLGFFAGLVDLPLDTHDEDYFLDSADALADYSFFFDADKRMPGRPALELALLLQYLVWGTDVATYHLFGGLLHLCAALALARAGRAMGLDLDLALLTGLLFLVNVSHFNAVHWISAQCYALVLICGCLALVYYLRDRPTPVYALLVCGVLIHVAAAAFLPFFLYLSWRRGVPMAAPMRRYLPLGLGLAAAITILKLGFPHAPQAGIVAAGFDPLGILRNLLVNWSRLYTTAHWLPHPLHLYPSWEWVLGGIGLFAFIALQWRRSFPLSAWHAWIFVHLLPPLVLTPEYVQTIPSGPSRYLYLASAGMAGLLAWALHRLAGLVPAWPRPTLVLMTALVLCSSYFGLKRAEAISFYASGRHYLASHQLDEGIAQLRRAIAIAPATIDLEDTYVRLVPMLFNRGDAEAVRALTAALERFPRNHTLRLVRLALDSLTAPEAARARHKLDSFKRAAGVSRLVAEIYYNIGRGRQHHGDGPGAVRAFRRSLEFDPQRSQTLQSLTTALATP